MRFAFLLLLFPSASFAFMNIESIRQVAKEGTSGSVGAKLNGASGNTEKLSTEFTTLTLVRSDLNEYLAAGKYRYGESRHVKDAHDGNLHLRYTRALKPWLGAESFGQSEFDEFKRLKRRDLAGAGLRTRLSQEGTSGLYLGTGLFYEHEIFEENIASEETFRANLYLSFVRTFSDHVSATLIGYYQPSFEGFGDTRALIDSGLQVHLTEKLALTLEFDLQYDSQPPAGVKQTDTSYLTGLAYAY
jgi:putative salt-induced outer membrane protein YdiY